MTAPTGTQHPHTHWWVNREDWRAFVEQFEHDHSTSAAEDPD